MCTWGYCTFTQKRTSDDRSYVVPSEVREACGNTKYWSRYFLVYTGDTARQYDASWRDLIRIEFLHQKVIHERVLCKRGFSVFLICPLELIVGLTGAANSNTKFTTVKARGIDDVNQGTSHWTIISSLVITTKQSTPALWSDRCLSSKYTTHIYLLSWYSTCMRAVLARFPSLNWVSNNVRRR